MTTSSAHYIFDILRLIGRESGPFGATDVSRKLGLSLTTAHRGLNTLERAGYVARYQASTKYVLGDRSRALLHSFFSRFPLREIALPYMQRLVVMTGDTSSLFVPIGWYAVRIASVKGTNEVIHTGPLGETVSLERGTAGRAILAYLPEAAQARFQDRVLSQTGAAERLVAELGVIRRQGYASGQGDTGGADHLAFPILDNEKTAIGALAIEGNSARTAASLDDAQIAECRQVVEQLSNVVGTGARKVQHPFAHLDPDQIALPG